MTQSWQMGQLFPSGNGKRETESTEVGYAIIDQLHQQLIRDIDETALWKLHREEAREQVERAARLLASERYPQLVGDAKEEIVSHVVNEVLGLGPIEPLLRDPSISEVMVNAPDEVYYERDGIIYESGIVFRDQAHVYRIIDRIVAAIGRHVDEASPMVDARLADGSRVNIIIPPLVPKSPTITIRKFRGDRYTMTELVQIGTLAEGIARLLEACVKAKLNIVVSGGTGTGKTTLLNAVSAFIPDRERIVTVEDPIELKLQQRHVVALEARPPSIEGRGEVTQRDLVRNALRMRPDRIIVGEVRGPEAFDMMQAMNTGHEGSLTTVHANSPRDALARIENMVLMAGFDLPVLVIREQMASALHLIVQLSRLVRHPQDRAGDRSGRYGRQSHHPSGHFRLQADRYRPPRPRPWRAAGHRHSSQFADRLRAFGVDLTEDIFNVGRWG